MANGYFEAEAAIQPTAALQPGQWLVAENDTFALFQQPAQDRLQLICAPNTPDTVSLHVGGTAQPTPTQPTLMIAKGLAGLGGLLFAAQAWKAHYTPLFALLILEPPLPFQSAPSRIWWPGAPNGAIATLPLLEDWGIPTRLIGDFPGGFDGSLDHWLNHWQHHHPDTCQIIAFNL